jgi:hypothetical protein
MITIHLQILKQKIIISYASSTQNMEKQCNHNLNSGFIVYYTVHMIEDHSQFRGIRCLHLHFFPEYGDDRLPLHFVNHLSDMQCYNLEDHNSYLHCLESLMSHIQYNIIFLNAIINCNT